MKPRRIVFALVAVVLALARSSYADVLAQYTFGTTSVPSIASSDANLFSVAGMFFRGSGFDAETLPDTGNGNPPPDETVNASLTPADQASAISGNDYYTFTLTPGTTMSLTDIRFDYAVAGNVTANYLVEAAVGAGSFSAVGSSVSTSSSTWLTPEGLSLGQYQNVTLPVTFRIYIWDNNDGNGNSDLLDNVIVDGFAPVPEASTLAMMGLGAALIGAAQRYVRKRR